MTTVVNQSTFNYFGISTSRNGFVNIGTAGGLDASTGLIVQNAGLLDTLRQDLLRDWLFWENGNSSGGENAKIVYDDVNSTQVSKTFFNEVTSIGSSGNATTPYVGDPNFGVLTTPRGTTQLQHVCVLETTDEMSPNRGQVSRGVDQKYRVRFEYDERPRLYQDDLEFAEQLYQLNIKLQEIGGVKYETGNTIDDTALANAYPGHPGYDQINVTLSAGWENVQGIPNPSYTWLKMQIGTKNQIKSDGTTSDNLTYSDGVITLGNGASVNTAVSRRPGEVVDMNFEDVTLLANDGDPDRSVRFRNKRKGPGWFKRFPLASDADPNVTGTYPMSYRITLTERGFFLAIYNEAGLGENDNYAWINVQRTANNETGLPRTDEGSRFPTHCIYSCSREQLTPRDFGVYFSEAAANLQTASAELGAVYDSQGNSYSVSQLTESVYILNPYDREDFLADEFLEKKIWRFVVREMDILKPWDVHKSATRHQIDSNAILNPQEQLAITDNNSYAVTFPTGLTTQRYMYPKEEADLICFSSAEVVAEGTNVDISSYKYDGTNIDYRKYQGIRSTLPNGNGMRVCCLVRGHYIYNTDVGV